MIELLRLFQKMSCVLSSELKNQNVATIYIFIWLMSFFERCGPLGNYCKFVNAYLYVAVSVVYASIFKVGC